MRRIATATIALGVGLTGGAAWAQCDSGETVVKFSHVVAEQGHPKGEAAAALAERVNSEMDGTLCMEVYPNTQLYNDDKVLQAMLLGDVQMAAPSLSKFEQYTLQYRIFDLPFLFEDIDAVDRFQQSETGQEMLTAMEDKGLVGLGYWHNGMKQLSANKPLLEPSDAQGLKFRIQESDVLEAQFSALGANPQKMAFAEVYLALQQGVVDGQENTWSNIYTQKFFEVQDGITETNHGVIDYLVVTSTEFLESLDEEARDQLITIFNEVTQKYNDMSNQINEEAKQKIIDAGTEVRQLTDEQRQKWVETMQPVWEEFQEDIGEDKIKAAQASNESA
ncbi:MAG TPA: DctP family TRAP transporter solute-binding subunit [Geminicoccaceae bacterium]